MSVLCNNIVGPLQMPPFRPGGPNFGTAHHASKNMQNIITIYLQGLNRLKYGKDAAVLGKQVLMLDEKKNWKYTFSY